ncbi:MAG: hypothetical protein WBF67_00565 [Olleya sp.]
MDKLREKSQDVKNKMVKTPKYIELLTKLSDLMEEQNALLKASKK